MPTQTQFTVDLANRMLPLVRRIVADLVTDYRRWQDAVGEFEALNASRPGTGDPRLAALQRDVQRLAADIEHYRGELARLGVECTGFEQGLVDFPGEIDGQRACLCWQLGEPAVEWWHTPEAGFAGRRRIAPAAAGDVAEAVR